MFVGRILRFILYRSLALLYNMVFVSVDTKADITPEDIRRSTSEDEEEEQEQEQEEEQEPESQRDDTDQEVPGDNTTAGSTTGSSPGSAGSRSRSLPADTTADSAKARVSCVPFLMLRVSEDDCCYIDAGYFR